MIMKEENSKPNISISTLLHDLLYNW